MEATLTPPLAPPEAETRLKMSYEEFLALPGEHAHAEWMDGEVIQIMPPKIRHQDVVMFLASLMRFFVNFYRLGTVLPAPVEMKATSDGPAREPDILFVRRENLARLTENRLQGPADLVVEVISNESVGRDRGDKFYEYQAAGIPEYWLFDPRPGLERADFWVLDETGRYRPVPIDAQGIYRSTVIPGFWLRVDWLWADELPDPQQTFAQIAGFPSEVIAALKALAERGPQS